MFTVLIVDDEKVVRDGCSRILAADGYRALAAANGREALDLLEVEPVNTVLCDLKMPVMGAIEVLEEVNSRYPDLPLIVITGHGTVADAVECMKKGAYDFVTKPFRVDHLLLIVKRALEKQTLERRARELQERQERNLYDLTLEQSRLRTIINCMADGVLVTNRDLEVVLHNPAFTRLLGPSTSVRQPAPLSDFFRDDTLGQTFRDMLAKACEANELISREISVTGIHLRALSAPVHGPDPNQGVLGSVTVFHDISSFRQLDEMKNNFIHMVAHELRSPLATIQQQHTVILEELAGGLTGKQRELLGRSREKVASLIELINDLLDVARMESGHAVQQQVLLNLGEIVQNTVLFMHSRAELQGVRLELDLDDELPQICADPRSMDELFTNLISNAINYSPEGGEVCIVALRCGDCLEVRVKDNGIGIAPEEITKIFDKFYRVKHPRTRQVIGTGLGLAIVKGIVESHRGSVEVESEPGVGTTFRILLPLA